MQQGHDQGVIPLHLSPIARLRDKQITYRFKINMVNACVGRILNTDQWVEIVEGHLRSSGLIPSRIYTDEDMQETRRSQQEAISIKTAGPDPYTLSAYPKIGKGWVYL